MSDMDAGCLETDAVEVSALLAEDLDAIVRIDKAITGRSRMGFLRHRLDAALRDASVRVALKAHVEGNLVGFVLGAIYYGEFGVPEPSAVVDVIGVHPEFAGRHVGAALFRQLEMQLGALGIDTLRTEVDWSQQGLLHFLEHQGFTPAARLCLEKRVGR
jgi:ribosomal protein S18 acetylase RimI-like enzyme